MLQEFLYGVQMFIDQYIIELPFYLIPPEKQLAFQRKKRRDRVNKMGTTVDKEGTNAWLFADGESDVKNEVANWKGLMKQEVELAMQAQKKGNIDEESRHRAKAAEYAEELEVAQADLDQYLSEKDEIFQGWEEGKQMVDDAVAELEKKSRTDRRDLARLNRSQAVNIFEKLRREMSEVLPAEQGQSINERIRERTAYLNAESKSMRSLTSQLVASRKARQAAKVEAATPGAKVLLSQMMSNSGYQPTDLTAQTKAQ